MSRWSKRSEEDKEQIFRREQHQERVNNTKLIYPCLSSQQLKERCDDAKRKAGHEGKHCSVCDLRCPNCPFEFAWIEEQKSV